MDAGLRSQGQAEVNRGSPSTSRQSPLAFLAEIRPKIRLLAVGFNGQIRKGTPFSFDSADPPAFLRPLLLSPGGYLSDSPGGYW